jgi:hypothetical protein
LLEGLLYWLCWWIRQDDEFEGLFGALLVGALYDRDRQIDTVYMGSDQLHLRPLYILACYISCIILIRDKRVHNTLKVGEVKWIKLKD